MREAAMKKLQITQRILDCEENGWNDLLVKVDNITQNIIDAPSASFHIKAALLFWCDQVDARLSTLPPDEDYVFQHNPSMPLESLFGTEV
jgi:hypothetical protein